jgi:hypothetical protein
VLHFGAMPSFLPGRELAARFYAEAVRPILDASFSEPPPRAALIGSGSEVLGFDTPVSADQLRRHLVGLYERG